MDKNILPDFLVGIKETRSLYSTDYTDPSARLRALELASKRTLSDGAERLLREQNPGRTELVDKLRSAGSVAVITGQQLGLFGGPVFTLYKILTAIKLSARLEEETAIPTVPLFWMQSEDHDFEEIRSSHFLLKNRDIRSVALQVPRDELGGSVGRLALKDPILHQLHAEISQILGDAEFKNGKEILELINRSYAHGASLGEAFKSFMREVLKDYPVLFFDPDRKDLKNEYRDLIATSFLRAREIERTLRERSAEIEALGYVVQVPVKPRSPLFFLTLNGSRVRLEESSAGDYLGPGIALSKEELFQKLEHSPEDFSSSALIRPILQDRIFPTAAYVAGPSEFNYWAQIQPLYRFFNLDAPMVVPRAGFTVIDPIAKRLIDKSGVQIESLRSGTVDLVAEKLRGSKFDAGRIFGTLETGISRLFEEHSDIFTAVGGDLNQAVQTTRASIAINMQKFRGKYEQVLLQKESTLAGRIDRLRNMLYPSGKDQERLLCVAHFLAAYGMDFPKQVYEALDPLSKQAGARALLI